MKGSFAEYEGLFCGICRALLRNMHLVSQGDSVGSDERVVAVDEVESSSVRCSVCCGICCTCCGVCCMCCRVDAVESRAALLWERWVSFVGYLGLFCRTYTQYPEATVSEALGWQLR